MDDTATMIRHTITINDGVFPLAQGDVVEELMSRIEAAIAAGGRFVEFTEVGNRIVRVLVTAHSQVSISSEPIQTDHRDDGDLESPFGSHFDNYS